MRTQQNMSFFRLIVKIENKITKKFINSDCAENYRKLLGDFSSPGLLLNLKLFQKLGINSKL